MSEITNTIIDYLSKRIGIPDMYQIGMDNVYHFHYRSCLFSVKFMEGNSKLQIQYYTPTIRSYIMKYVDLQKPNGLDGLDTIVEEFTNDDNWEGTEIMKYGFIKNGKLKCLN